MQQGHAVTEDTEAGVEANARVVALMNEVERLALLDLLVADAPAGIAFFDTDLRFQLANQQLAEYVGVPIAELIGHDLAYFAPSLRETADELLQQVVGRGEVVAGKEITGVTPASPTPRTWLSSWYPVRLPDAAEVSGMAMITFDITDRMRDERLRALLSKIAHAETVEAVFAATVEHLESEVGPNVIGIWIDNGHGALQLIERGFSTTQAIPEIPMTARTPLTDAVRNRTTVQVRSHDELGQRYPDSPLHRLSPPVHACVAVPLRTDEHVFGVLAATWNASDMLDDQVKSYIETLSNLLQGALLRSMTTEREQALMVSLQNALAPEIAPISTSQCEATGRTIAAGSIVGGDFYESSVRDDGCVVLVTGDVAGHGIASAARMAETKFRLSTLLRLGQTPAQALVTTNAFLTASESFVTVSVAVYDPTIRTITWASAGHCAPALLSASGNARFLDHHQPGFPLGIEPDAAYRDEILVLQDGDTFLLYSDGLIERRGESYTDGELRLLKVLARSSMLEVGALIERLIGECPDPQRIDDLSVLALRVHPTATSTG